MQIIGGSGLEVIEKVQVIEKTTVPPAQSRVGVRERERKIFLCSRDLQWGGSDLSIY